jgi:hypothetical protein
MKKEDLIKLGLDDAAATKVAEASSEELKDYVPKARFNEVNEEKKQLDKDVAARDTQLETLKKSTGDVDTLKKTITDLQAANATEKANYEAQTKQLKIDHAVDAALAAKGAKNVKAAKALLDMAKIELDGENLKGFDDQIKTLTESETSKFLFTPAAPPAKPQLKGFQPGEHKEGAPGGGEKPKTLAEAVQAKLQADQQQT